MDVVHVNLSPRRLPSGGEDIRARVRVRVRVRVEVRVICGPR